VNAVVTDLSYRLCAPVGGINEGTNLSGVRTQASNATMPVPPVPIAFTGGSTLVVANAGIWMSLVVLSVGMGALIA